MQRRRIRAARVLAPQTTGTLEVMRDRPERIGAGSAAWRRSPRLKPAESDDAQNTDVLGLIGQISERPGYTNSVDSVFRRDTAVCARIASSFCGSGPVGLSEEAIGMYSHLGLWRAIDVVASRKGLSLPRLAISAGLDPTALNPSKRTGKYGKPHWPSTETLAKLLSACDVTFAEFCQI